MDPYATPQAESNTQPPSPSVLPLIVGVVGILFTILNGILVAGSLMNGYTIARHSMDTSQLAAVIGETLITVACIGLFAIIPATLLDLAIRQLRLRRRWFYTCALICALYFLLLPPFGTIFGIILLIALRRRRAEFNAPVAPIAGAALNTEESQA